MAGDQSDHVGDILLTDIRLRDDLKGEQSHGETLNQLRDSGQLKRTVPLSICILCPLTKSSAVQLHGVREEARLHASSIQLLSMIGLPNRAAA